MRRGKYGKKGIRRRRGRRRYRRGKKIGRYFYSKPKSVLSSRGVTGKSLRCKFNYQQSISLTCTGGAFQSYVFRGNSLYDPDQTGAGTQPPGFDEMSSFYAEYCCYGSKISVKLSTSATIPINIAVLPFYSNALTVSTWSSLSAMPKCRKHILKNIYGGGTGYVKNYSTTALETRRGISSAETWAVFGANPDAQWYWQLCAVPVDFLTTVTVIMDVTITFYTLMGKRKIVNNS